jgi:hypothetical protein
MSVEHHTLSGKPKEVNIFLDALAYLYFAFDVASGSWLGGLG